MKLMVNVVVVVMVVLVGAMAVGAQSACNPNPDCTDKVMGDKVEDPQNCTNFYVCFGDGIVADQPSACDNGTFFDASASDCAMMPADGCEPSCPIGGGGSGICKLLCNGSLDFVSDPTTCGNYLLCVPGDTSPLTCPPEHPYFDGTNCGNDESLCCVPGCEPECVTPKTLIPDPKDCHRYYYCEVVGLGEENYHYTCPDGGVYDFHLGECSVGAPCTVLCPDTP